MTTSKSGLRLFVSGEPVEPGVYRDIVTGATVMVCEPDTLPDRIRIVREQRLFMRLVETSEGHTAATGG
jgi:hypothetical protein